MRSAVYFLPLFIAAVSSRNPCARRDYSAPASGGPAFGCICTKDYCDDIEPLGTIQKDAFVSYVSSRETNRLDRVDFHFTGFPNASNIVVVNAAHAHQTMYGFGGAITDAAGVNLLSLSAALRDKLMQQYYGPGSIDYRITRTPMASCDFSTHEYSYDDVPGDLDLVHFNLTAEDYALKIPFIRQAMALVSRMNDSLKLYTTAWSAPGWMKTTGRMKGGGRLRGDMNGPYYQAYTNYFIKYFEAYHALGIDFWGVTPENEPSAGLLEDYAWQSMFFDAEMERDWIRGTLGPGLRNSPVTKNIKLMIGDDQRYLWPVWADIIFADAEAAKYVDGMATHWYADSYVPEVQINITTQKYPNKFMLATEACTGYMPGEGTPIFGDWFRGEEYAKDIIVDIRNGMVGWVDWNIVLDTQGGPNWVNNTVDAPIIANATNDEFIKQPMFYALGHFSYFVKPDFRRVDLALAVRHVDGVAFLAPDNAQRVVVLLNSGASDVSVSLQDASNPVRYANVHLPMHSITTVVYNM